MNKTSRECQPSAGSASKSCGVGYRHKKTFLRLHSVFVRPNLEYAVTSWNPWTRKDRDCLEKVQRRSLAMAVKLKGRAYEERLKEE